MSWSRSIKARGSAAVSALLAQAGLATLLLVVPAPAVAQGSVEDLYQRAMELYNKPDAEGACEQFRKIEQQSPGYKDVRILLGPACASANKQYEIEDKLFSDCSDLYKQGNIGDAKVKCQAALGKSNTLRHPKHKDQAAQILRDIDAKNVEAARKQQQQSQCDRIFQEATTLARHGSAEGARDKFSQVVQMGCPQASDAQTRIGQIDAQLHSKVAEAEREKRGKVPAKNTQEQASAGGPPGGSTGGKLPPPEPKEVSGNEDLLKAGLRAYFSGDYAKAETSLTRYLNNHGAKSALAYFFRGATHGARYFLSGEKESDEKSQALADFRDASIQRLGSKPSEKFVPPKILALYQEAVATGSQ